MDCFTVLPGAEHEISYTIAEDCLFLLVIIQRIEKSERLVAFLPERTNGFSVDGIECRLSAGKRWREDTAFTGDGDVERKMVAAILQHPGIFFRGRSQNRDVVKIFAKECAAARSSSGRPIRANSRRRTIITSSRRAGVISVWRSIAKVARWLICLVSFVHFVAFHNLLDLLKAFRAQRSRDQSHGGGALSGSHFLEADTAARNNAGRKVGPACTLLFVIKGEQNFLALLRIKRG